MNGLFFSIVGSRTRRSVAILLSFVLFATSFTLTPAKAYADDVQIINNIEITGPTSAFGGDAVADVTKFAVVTSGLIIESVSAQKKNDSTFEEFAGNAFSSGTYRYKITVNHDANSNIDDAVGCTYNGNEVSYDISGDKINIYSNNFSIIDSFNILFPNIESEVCLFDSVSELTAVTDLSQYSDSYDAEVSVWKENDNAENRFSRDYFESGTYRYRIDLVIKDGCQDTIHNKVKGWGSNISWIINGKSYKEFGDIGRTDPYYGKKIYFKSGWFTVNSSKLGSLTADITCENLNNINYKFGDSTSLSGFAPSLSVSLPENSGFSCGLHWEKGDALYTADTFAAGGEYKLVASVIPPEGFSFSERTATKIVKLNGEPATLVRVSSESVDVLLGSITITAPVQEPEGEGTGNQEQGSGEQEQETGGQEQESGGQEQESGGQEQTTDVNLNYDALSEKTVVTDALAEADNTNDPGYGVVASISAAKVTNARVIIPEQVLATYENKQEYAGKKLSITSSVTPVTTEHVGQAEVDSFNTEIPKLGLSNPSIRLYEINLDLMENETKIDSVTDTVVPVEIKMSVSGNSMPRSVISYHNGAVKPFYPLPRRNTVGDMNAGKEGFFVDSTTLYLYSCGFSTFALIYENAAPNPAAPSPSISVKPADNPVPDPVYEEPPQIVEMIPVYRLYNTFTGSHFFTINWEESNEAVNCGYEYEGVGFMTPSYSSVPVYRLYDYDTDEHYYTIDFVEAQLLASNGGFVYEGIAWYSAEPSGQTVYVLRASGSLTVYTISVAERDMLKSLGWEEKKAGFFAG